MKKLTDSFDSVNTDFNKLCVMHSSKYHTRILDEFCTQGEL